MSNTLNVVIVDDHKMFLDGVVALLEETENIQVIAALADSSKFEEVLKKNRVDLLISDIAMPGPDGKDLCRMVKKRSPETRILIVSMYEDIHHISELLKLGIAGYLPKNSGKNELLEAVHALAEGRTFYGEKVKDTVMQSLSGQYMKQQKSMGTKLTKRELEVIALIASEHTSQEIADKLFISLNTAETHRKNIFRKTNTKNMAGLIRYALKNGIID